jgi:hypothetical protein
VEEGPSLRAAGVSVAGRPVGRAQSITSACRWSTSAGGATARPNGSS